MDTYISSGGVSVAALATLFFLPFFFLPFALGSCSDIVRCWSGANGLSSSGKRLCWRMISSGAAGSIQIDDASVRGDKEATERSRSQYLICGLRTDMQDPSVQDPNWEPGAWEV